MNETGGGVTFSIARVLWRLTFEPMYRWLFRSHFDAITARLDDVAARLGASDASLRNQSKAMSDYGVELRTHIHGLNLRLNEIDDRVAALEEQVRVMIAGQWEQEAITRRLASLEDRIPARGTNGPAGVS